MKDSCRVLELGAGPGTATMGLISFFSELASATPDRRFILDITAIEKEKSFQPIFEILTEQLIAVSSSNLTISIKLVHADALGSIPEYSQKYDLVIESNMLNLSEGMEEQSIDAFARVLSKAMDEESAAIMIEPGKNDDRAFLTRLESFITRERIAASFVPPKTTAVDITGISLYQEAIAAGLRGTKKTVHWFSYLVMERRPFQYDT